MALIQALGHKLPLAGIYRWISTHFSFYKLADTGWQKSIRHHLSMSPKFTKIKRPKDQGTRGYWTIVQRYKHEFIEMKMRREFTIEEETNENDDDSLPVIVDTKFLPQPMIPAAEQPQIPAISKSHSNNALTRNLLSLLQA